MLSLRLVEQAREALRHIVTTDEARMQLMRASVELAEHGPAGLRAYLDDSGTAALSSPSVGVDAMRLYHVAGDLKNAVRLSTRCVRRRATRKSTCMTSTQVRVGYSSALICAAVLLASGERAEGLRLLDGLDGLLDRLEKNGWAESGTRLASRPVSRAARATRCCDAVVAASGGARLAERVDGANRPLSFVAVGARRLQVIDERSGSAQRGNACALPERSTPCFRRDTRHPAR